jgi:hypothetical protein
MDNTKYKLEKVVVCRSCLSDSILYSDCICTYKRNYPTIELEFEVCKCCGNLINDGQPANTEFNKQQYENS